MIQGDPQHRHTELERQIQSKKTSIKLMITCIDSLTFQLADLLDKQQELGET